MCGDLSDVSPDTVMLALTSSKTTSTFTLTTFATISVSENEGEGVMGANTDSTKSPMKYSARIFLAFVEWIALNSSVASIPEGTIEAGGLVSMSGFSESSCQGRGRDRAIVKGSGKHKCKLGLRP